MDGHAMKTLSSRIRLLEFLTYFYLGGTERQVMNLSTGIDRDLFDLHLGCLGKVGEYLEEATSRGTPVMEYKIDSLYNLASWKTRLRFGQYLHDRAIEIVHSYGFYSNVFAVPAARLSGVPVIIASIRDCGETLTANQKRAQRIVCRMADCILANAEGVRKWLLAEGYPAAKIHVIRNGIVPEGAEAAQPAGRLRQELGLSRETQLVAVVSRLNAMKGIEYFLEAVAIVSQRFPLAHFLIIGGPSRKGDDGYKAEVERYVDRLGLGHRVTLTGFRSDVKEILPEIDISVLPSLSEGLSNSLLESMVAGVPTIATKVGGTPEVVDDGVTGLLVPSHDAGALVQAMSTLLENPTLRFMFGEAGRRRAMRLFSIEKMVRQTESLYLELLREKRVRYGHGRRQVVTS
jgi:glycosyltransferase involved in cell wall biosynthesis